MIFNIYLVFISDLQDESSELNPLMLTLLGVGSGILAVVILVGVAIRFHAARGNNGGRRCTESATNKVQNNILKLLA